MNPWSSGILNFSSFQCKIAVYIAAIEDLLQNDWNGCLVCLYDK